MTTPFSFEPDELPREGVSISTILVVDDEPSVRESLAAYFEINGYSVLLAADATAAAELLESNVVDLVFTDISMAGMTGLELLHWIKARSPETEVFMITGSLELDHAIQALRGGACDFFTKPLNFERIGITVKRAEEKKLLAAQAQLYQVLKQQKQFEDQATLETTLSLARAVEERDRFNIGHGRRTGNYAKMLAAAIGFDDNGQRLVRMGGLVHDVGKIGIDDMILNKPGKLDAAEFTAVKRHPEIGEYIVKPISFMRTLALPVRHHHERWDGTGYPDKLAGEEIPVMARILCIADYFDSLTSARPYRNPIPIPEALQIMREERGKTFDPALLGEFFGALERAVPEA
ncbi:MAG: response regulator [Planctomycetes bacterium]|nr:response regulator [Planctomycetota bacterium]